MEKLNKSGIFSIITSKKNKENLKKNSEIITIVEKIHARVNKKKVFQL